MPLTVREAPATAQEKVKILVVDDHPENLFSVEAVLESLGQEIVPARSGAEALRRLLEDDFAAILLDVMMPGIDGFETAALIRQRERCRDTPILFLTAINKTDEHVHRGYEIGAVDYLFKPIMPDVLRAKVAAFVELSRKRRQIERALAEKAEAERRIRKLNADLERRLRELTDAYRELDAFTYTVSHDLQTPVRRMEGFAQALADSAAGKLDEQEMRWLNSIAGNARRMAQLVQEMLKLSRIGRSDLRREQVDVTALARKIAADLKERNPDRGVAFRVAEGLSAWADARLVEIALGNLLDNAWKFTAGRPDARIEVARENAAFVVRDNGVGFDMAQAARLFAPFQRFHLASEFEGSGIGLATVHRIIQRHGGRIWADAAPDRGAAFFFTLPAEGE